ncbi:MAG TPA: HTH domain-containing protein [Anaerolineae bacterium]|nr:HTH domain-containing protein [Anaerolineae bacterium]
MNVLDAVHRVLSEAGRPLHYRDITERLVAGGLWTPKGKTPHATVNARLTADIKRYELSSRFRRVGAGVYALGPSAAGPGGDSLPRPDPTGTVSFTKAAEVVLDRFADHKPMHYREITEKALELGFIKTAGRTPEATMYAQILMEIQRQQRRLETPRFVKHGKGLVGLTRWEPAGLAGEIEEHNDHVRKELLQHIRQMPPAEFEALIGKLLAKIGFDSVEVTRHSGDGGIDVRGVMVVGGVVATRMAVQVKRWKHNVQAPMVQQVRGSLGPHEHGLIITTSEFSDGARQEALKATVTPIALVNGEELVSLLIEHNIEVRRTTHDIIELGEGTEEE